MADVTQWLPGTVKPVRPGVYEREFPHRPLFAEWTGYQWLIAATTVRAAKRKRQVSQQQDDIRWRGLAADPSGVAPSDAPSAREAMQMALSALHAAVAGLEWYRDRCPDAVDGSDSGADDEIGAAIAALDAALTVGVRASEVTLPKCAYWWSPKEGSGLSPSLACWSTNTGPHPEWDVTAYYSEAQVRELLAAHGVKTSHEPRA